MTPSLPLTTLARYTTPPSRCGYLPAERSSLAYRVLVDVTAAQHEALLARGWRRFGCEWFRPVCPACTACWSLRIPLATFTPSRSQRRALRGNATIEVVVQAPTITGAHLRLYNAYHAAMQRQKGWPWHPMDPIEYFQTYLGGGLAVCPGVPLLRAGPPHRRWPGGYHADGALQCVFLPRSCLAATSARRLFDPAAARLRAAARVTVSLPGVLDRGVSLHGL